MNQTQKQNLKRRNTPRLPIVYTTAEILQKLDHLAGIHGSKKAAIEAAIVMLFDRDAKSVAAKARLEYEDNFHYANE